MKYLLLIIIFNISCYSQTSNINILDSLISNTIDSSIDQNLLKDSITYDLEIFDNYNTRIFESNIYEKLLEYNINFKEDNSGVNKLIYSLDIIDLKYIAIDNLLIRDLSINISNKIIDKNRILKVNYRDTINRNQLPNIQTKEIDYLFKSLPKKKESKVNKYFKPILIILSAAASIYLLFSVRSK